MKVGDQYFSAHVDSDEGTVCVDLWVITVLRAGRAYACRKDDYTWVKRSSKTGDYGWAPNLSAYDRRMFVEGEPPAEWAKTRAAAYSKALPDVEQAIKRLTKLRAQMLGQRTKARGRAVSRHSPDRPAAEPPQPLTPQGPVADPPTVL